MVQRSITETGPEAGRTLVYGTRSFLLIEKEKNGPDGEGCALYRSFPNSPRTSITMKVDPELNITKLTGSISFPDSLGHEQAQELVERNVKAANRDSKAMIDYRFKTNQSPISVELHMEFVSGEDEAEVTSFDKLLKIIDGDVDAAIAAKPIAPRA